jgi:hypothetical protein
MGMLRPHRGDELHFRLKVGHTKNIGELLSAIDPSGGSVGAGLAHTG